MASYELWRVAVADGAVTRLTDGRHRLSSFDAVATGGATRHVYLRSTPTSPPDLWVRDEVGTASAHVLQRRRAGRADAHRAGRAAERGRWTIDPGLVHAGRRAKRSSLVTEIHGGSTHAATRGRRLGIPDPRPGRDRGLLLQPARSEGYGQDFNEANTATGVPGRCATCWPAWMRSSRRAWPNRTRLGVTGGSYGGYLTNWIVATTSASEPP